MGRGCEPCCPDPIGARVGDCRGTMMTGSVIRWGGGVGGLDWCVLHRMWCLCCDASFECAFNAGDVERRVKCRVGVWAIPGVSFA